MANLPKNNLLLYEVKNESIFLRERISRLEQRIQYLEDKNDNWLRNIATALVTAIATVIFTKILS